MAVTVTPGTQIRYRGVFDGVDALTQSTATAERQINPNLEMTTLSGGTATGFELDKYFVPAAAEGTRKLIVMLATGEAKIRFGAATTNLMATSGIHIVGQATATSNFSYAAGALVAAATGAFVFNSENQWMDCAFWNDAWHILGGNPTIATST